MTPDEFSYHAVSQTEGAPPSGLIAMRLWMGPLHAVIWSNSNKRWMYNPRVAAPWIFDDQYQDRQKEVPRQEAERIGRERLGTELPSEEELLRMCLEGAQAQK